MLALFGKSKYTPSAQAINNLYNSAVDAARQPVFYAQYGVPDTPDGRFDMIVLHMFLIMERLRYPTVTEEGKIVSQALFDYMFSDMDRSLREMGIGDLGVPKHMRRMMKGFNGRVELYHQALTVSNDDLLRDTVRKNIFFSAENPDQKHITAIVNYFKKQHHHLQDMAWEEVLSGSVQFIPEEEQ